MVSERLNVKKLFKRLNAIKTFIKSVTIVFNNKEIFSFVRLGRGGGELEELFKERYYISLRSMFIKKKCSIMVFLMCSPYVS